MQRIGHTVVAVVAGVVVAFALAAAIDWLGQQAYPTAAGVDLSNPGQARDHVGNLPVGALMLVLVSWSFMARIRGLRSRKGPVMTNRELVTAWFDEAWPTDR